MTPAEEDALVQRTMEACGFTSGGTNYVLRTADEIRLAIRAAVAAERERCAKVCEKRAEDRFSNYGITEPDTNASYYPKGAEWCAIADEEDDECAAAIREGEK